MTGGGRCNITNANFDMRLFLNHFKENSKFLFSTFSQFNVQNTMDFFENLGLPLVTEARNRVFPKSQKSMDVLKLSLSRGYDCIMLLATYKKNYGYALRGMCKNK